MMRRARENREANSFSTKNMEQPNSLYEVNQAAQAYMGKPISKLYVRSDLLFESVLDSLPTNPCHELYQPGVNSVSEDYEEIRLNSNHKSNTVKMIHTLSQLKRLRRDASSHACPTNLSQSKRSGEVVSRNSAMGGCILAINMSNPRMRPTLSLSGSAVEPNLHPVNPLRGNTAYRSFTVVAIEQTKTQQPKVELGYSILSDTQKKLNALRIQAKDPYVPPPKTRKQMLKDSFSADYIRAEEEEITSLWSFGTWGLVRRSSIPRHGKILKTKWVYADKLERDGRVGKLKARLTAMGCFQRAGIDYHETFASVSRTQTLRILMVI